MQDNSSTVQPMDAQEFHKKRPEFTEEVYDILKKHNLTIEQGYVVLDCVRNKLTQCRLI